MATTSTWTCNASRSWRTIYGWRSDNTYVYQGQTSGYGLHRGLLFFNDSNIRSVLSGQTILRVRLRLTRRSSGGSSGAQTPRVRLHNYSSQPSGTPDWASGADTSTSWAWGETKWTTLHNAFGRALRDGDARGIMLYHSNDAPYMIFNGVNSAILEIQHEPTLTAPNTPTGFSPTEVTTSSVSFEWNEVSDADHYRFTNQQLNPTGDVNAFIINGTTVRNVTGISSNNRYRWRVRAENSAGVSSYTDYVHRTTPPLTPTGITAVPREGTTGETQIRITWNHIPGTELEQYRVHRDGGPNLTMTNNAINWGGLSPDTTYRFRVRSENERGNSDYSDWYTAKTRLPAPATPNRPKASEVTETSARITWDAVSYASGYDLEHNGTVILSNVSGRNHVIDPIEDGATHEFRVRARNSTGTSSYSSTLTLNTEAIHDPPEVPTGLGPTGLLGPGPVTLEATLPPMSSSNDGLTQRVHWEISHSILSWAAGTSNWVTSGDVSISLTSGAATQDLGPGTYSVRARTEHSEDQFSEWSEPVEFDFTRLRTWSGNSWVPRKSYSFDGSDWVESPIFVRISGEWR